MAVAWAANGGVDKYGGDASRVVIMGQSAGAHQAALLAMPTSDFLSGAIKSTCLKGLVGISGIYSGPRFWQNPLHYALYSYIFDRTPDWNKCFALGFCCKGEQTGMCPTLLLNAGFDVGLQAHAFDFADALRQGGVSVEGPHVIAGTDHFSMMIRIGRGGLVDREVIPRISEFVRTVCERDSVRVR